MVLSRAWSRRGLMVIGLVAVCIAGPYSVQRIRFHNRMIAAKKALAQQQLTDARDCLLQAKAIKSTDAELEYLVAVVNRRLGELQQVDSHLTEAEKLGWSPDDIYRQRLLIRAQLGRFDDVDEALQKIIQEGTYDEAAVEIYEALANGYVANHALDEAMLCVDYWIRWHPLDINPRKMRADILMLLNDWSAAEVEYRKILEFAPDDGASREMLGSLLLDRGLVDEAKRELEQAIADGHTKATVYAALGMCEFRLGRLKEAGELLAGISLGSLGPEDQAGVLKLQSDIALYERDTEEAVRLLERAMEVWPHDSSIREALARGYVRLGKTELAEECVRLAQEDKDRASRFLDVQKQLRRDPKNPELRHRAGQILQEQGLAHDAATWFRSALRYEKRYLPSHLKLIEYYREIGDTEQERRHEGIARGIVNQSLLASNQAIEEGDFTSAESIQLALSAAELPVLAQTIGARILIRKGEQEAALELLQPLMNDTETRGAVAGTFGAALMGLSRPIEAEHLLKEAVAFNPQDIASHRWLAVIYYDLGAMTQAQQHLEKVAELDPADYRPFRLLGLVSKDYGFYSDAIDYYKEAIRRNPNMPPRNEVDLELAECLVAQNEYARALEILKSADSSPRKELLTAECFYSTERQTQAMEILDSVLEENPTMVRALILRADAALVDNQPEKAVELLERAIEKDPYHENARRRYSQALTRTGNVKEAQRQLKRSEELTATRIRFSKLHRDAIDRPFDAKIRHQLAEVATSIGRDDLSQAWKSVARFLEESTDDTVRRTVTPDSADVHQNPKNAKR